MANFTDFQSVFDLSSDAETDFDCIIGMEEDDMLMSAVEGFKEEAIPDVDMKDFEDLHNTEDDGVGPKDFRSDMGPDHDSTGANGAKIDSTKTQTMIAKDDQDILDLACPTYGVANAVEKSAPDPEHINDIIDSRSNKMEKEYEDHENSNSPHAESYSDYDYALDDLLREAEDEEGDPSTPEDAKESKEAENESADVDSLDDFDDVHNVDPAGVGDEYDDFVEETDIDDSADVESLEVDTDSEIEDEYDDDVHGDFGEPDVDPTHGKEIEGDEGSVIESGYLSNTIFDLFNEGDGCCDKNPVSGELDDCVHGDFGDPDVDPTHGKEIEGDEGPVVDEASVDSLEEEVVGDIGLRDTDMGMDDMDMGLDPESYDSSEEFQDEEDIDDVGLDEAFEQLMREAEEEFGDTDDDDDSAAGSGCCKKEAAEDSVDSLDTDDDATVESIDDFAIDNADDVDDMSDDEVSSLEDVEDDDILDNLFDQ